MKEPQTLPGSVKNRKEATFLKFHLKLMMQIAQKLSQPQPTLKNPSFTVKPTKERPKVQNITCKKPLQIQKLFRFYIQKNYSTLLFLRI